MLRIQQFPQETEMHTACYTRPKVTIWNLVELRGRCFHESQRKGGSTWERLFWTAGTDAERREHALLILDPPSPHTQQGARDVQHLILESCKTC